MSQILSIRCARFDVKGDLKKMERLEKELEKAQARVSFLLDQFHAHIEAHGYKAPKAVSATSGH